MARFYFLGVKLYVRAFKHNTFSYSRFNAQSDISIIGSYLKVFLEKF